MRESAEGIMRFDFLSLVYVHFKFFFYMKCSVNVLHCSSIQIKLGIISFSFKSQKAFGFSNNAE